MWDRRHVAAALDDRYVIERDYRVGAWMSKVIT